MAGENKKPDKKLAAVCGLFCPACRVYIANQEGDVEALKSMAERFGRPVKDLICEGCRSDKRSFYCNNLCTMFRCAEEKGVEFCGECPEYPCEALKEFQSQAPHRLELWNSLDRIREAGYEQWYREMVDFYSCRECGTINSAYDLKCRRCGAAPSCGFVEKHQQHILRHLGQTR